MRAALDISLWAGIERDNEAKAASVSGEHAAQRTVWWVVAGGCRGMNDAEDVAVIFATFQTMALGIILDRPERLSG
jgi:hypothetical protein